MNDLQHKIYKSEEENCTFTPKINNTKIKYSISFYDENNRAPSPFNKGINSKTISNNFNSNINVNINKYNNNNFILNETKSIKLLRKLANTNSFFYPETVKNQHTNNENNHNRRNSFRTFKILNNYHTSKDNIPLNYNKLIDNFIINELNEMKLLNQNQKYNELNRKNNLEKQNGGKIINKSKNTKYKNIIMKRNLSNKDKNINSINITNFNKINNIEIEDSNKENGLLNLNNNFRDLYNSKRRNRTVTKHNQPKMKQSSSLNDKDSKYKSIKSSNCNNNKILKKTQSTVLNKKDDKNQLKMNIDQEDMDYFKYKMNINTRKNILRKESTDSRNKAEKDFECKPKKKRINSLQKYSSSLYDFIEPNPEEKNIFNRVKINDTKRLKEINDIFKDVPLSKRNKSYSSIYANRNISNSYINNYTTNHNNILNGNQTYSIKEINDNLNNYVNNNNTKRSIPKIEYFYTFRNKKIQYNSFNCFSNFNPQTNKNIINKAKSSNESNNIISNKSNHKNSNIKASNSKNNKFGITILNNSKRKTNIRNIYHLNNKINSIYSNNYDKKNNYVINKITHILNDNNKSKNNSKSNNNSYAKIIRPSINTNNTNNDTKGYSSSTLSAKDIKTNSKRESKNNISIQNKNEQISKNIDNSNNKNIFIKNNKPNIRKYINDYNNKSNKENVNNKLNYNNNKDFEGLKITSKVSEEYFKYQKKQRNNDYNNKNERSMTLQSLSDSKMLEIAEHYINNYKDDILNDIGIKKIVFKKTKVNDNKNKNITFSEELK